MKTHASLNFSAAEENRLIDEVAKYPALYDAENKDHKDMTIRLNVWKVISEKMNDKTTQDCQKKWKNIRDSYMRFRRRKRKAGCEDGLPETSRYARLAFLDDVKCDKLNQGNIIEDHSAYVAEEDGISELENVTTTYKRKASETFSDDECKFSPKLLHNFTSQTRTEDEIDYFMISLGTTIKKFNQDLKRKVKIELLKIVNEYEKKNENDPRKST